MGIEKRKSRRTDIDMKISLNQVGDKYATGFSSNLIPVQVVNISQDGIAFKSDEVFPLNSYYGTVIKLSNSNTFEAVVEVVRAENMGEQETTYGCRFVGINSTDRFKIDVYQIVDDANMREDK